MYALVSGKKVMCIVNDSIELSTTLKDNYNVNVSLPADPTGVKVGKFVVMLVNHVDSVPINTLATGEFKYVVKGSVVERIAVYVPTPLKEAQMIKLGHLEKARDIAEKELVTVQGKQFLPSDGLRRLYLTGRCTKLSALVTVDGQIVPVTESLLYDIITAFDDNVEAAWNNFAMKAEEVMACKNVEDISNIIW